MTSGIIMEVDTDTDASTEVGNFTFAWRIENVLGGLSCCMGEYTLFSPNFITKTSFIAKWNLIFERSENSEDTFSVFIERDSLIRHPWQVLIDYELSIWVREGEPSHTKKGYKLKFLRGVTQELIGPVKIPELCDFKSFQRDVKIQCNITVHRDENYAKEGLFALSADMLKLLQSERFTDLELIAGDRTFHVHKIVLSYRQTHLLDHFGILTNGMSSPKTVEIADMDGDVLEELIYFFYSGKVKTRNPELLLELELIHDRFYIDSLENVLSAPVKKYVASSKSQSERIRFQWSIRNFSSTKNSKLSPIKTHSLNCILILAFHKSDNGIRFSMRKISRNKKRFTPIVAFVQIEAVKEDGNLLTVIKERGTITDESKWQSTMVQSVDAIKKENMSGLLKDDVLVLNLFIILRNTVKWEIEYSELASDWMTSCEECIGEPPYCNYYWQKFWDIELSVDGDLFKAHRAILSARSSVLAKMISQHMAENGGGVLHVDDVNSGIFYYLLEYIYTTIIREYRDKDLPNLYVCADRFAIPSLRHDCVNLMLKNLSEETVTEALIFADDYGEDRLKTAAMDFICTHADKVFERQQWKDFVRKRGDMASQIFLRLSDAVRRGLRSDQLAE